MGDEVKSRFRMFQRQGGVFYWQDNQSKQQGSLGTKDKHAAVKLLHAKNEAHEQPPALEARWPLLAQILGEVPRPLDRQLF